ncbi:hypothetical protein Bca4012_046717 [Brassica carinata]
MGLAHGQNPSTPYYRSKKPIELLGQLKNRAEARIKTRAKAQTARSGLTKTGAKEAWEETRVRILLISPPRVARLDLNAPSSHSHRPFHRLRVSPELRYYRASAGPSLLCAALSSRRRVQSIERDLFRH